MFRECPWVPYTWRRLAHLGWHEMERWRARGFEFGSHGATHRRLTWLPDSAVDEELGRSRETLIARLGPAAGTAIAYPFGAVDQRIEQLADEAGYALGFGGVLGTGERLNVPRVPVYLWDIGDTPLGLRNDSIGSLGKAAAHLANRCAVGTSLMKGLIADT